jgi:hypothetical protein
VGVVRPLHLFIFCATIPGTEDFEPSENQTKWGNGKSKIVIEGFSEESKYA